MIVEINKILNGEPSEIEPYNSIILCTSVSGIKLKIETSEDISKLEEYIDKKVEMLLIVNHLVIDQLEYFIEKYNHPRYEGKLIGKFRIGSEWKHVYNWKSTQLIGIETQEGILLTSKWACEKEKIKIGETIQFTAYSYDIVAWSPIE